MTYCADLDKLVDSVSLESVTEGDTAMQTLVDTEELVHRLEYTRKKSKSPIIYELMCC